MKYRPVKQRRRLRPRWDHLLFPLLSPFLSLRLSLSRRSRRNLSLFSPPRCPARPQSSAALTPSHFFFPYSTPVHPSSSPPLPPLGGFRSDDFNLSSGRKRSGTRSKGVTLTLPFFIFSSPSFYSPLFLFLFSHRCLRLEARRRRRRGG